jgi:hypothetical protein
MAISLGEKTADGILWTGTGRLAGVTLISNAAGADATIILYDALSATGTKVFEGFLDAATSDTTAHFNFDDPIRFEVGLYLDITGTAASCI